MEFTAAAAKVLSATGVYAVNVGDGPPLTHVRARVATVRAVFACTCLIAEPGVLRGRRFGNLIIAGAAHQLPVTELARRVASGPLPAQVIHGPTLQRFAATAVPITDASARPSPALPPKRSPEHGAVRRPLLE